MYLSPLALVVIFFFVAAMCNKKPDNGEVSPSPVLGKVIIGVVLAGLAVGVLFVGAICYVGLGGKL